MSIEKLINEMPKLHVWEGKEESGGFFEEHLENLFRVAIEIKKKFGSLVCVETGAGLSTLSMLAASPDVLHSICIDKDLLPRIKNAARRYGYNSSPLEYHPSPSEIVLPKLAIANNPVEAHLCIIDGGHGIPTTFVDFCYCNMMLTKGGVLVVDDLPLLAPRELFLLLKSQPGWEIELFLGKMAFFRKETDAKLMPDFGGQPYTRCNGVDPFFITKY